MHLQQPVLVAYATKHGATAGIAVKIGEILDRLGHPTEVRPVREIGDLAPFRAVVLGSAVYVGRWRPEAARFLIDREAELAKRPLWLFSSGPTGNGDPVQLMNGWRFPPALEAVARRLAPRDTAFFHGALNLAHLNLLERLMVRAVKAPPGDYRDWRTITDWATAIAREIGVTPG